MNREKFRALSRHHRAIDLQRPMVGGRLLYQVVCACGQRSLIGSRHLAETDQKQHKYTKILLEMIPEDKE